LTDLPGALSMLGSVSRRSRSWRWITGRAAPTLLRKLSAYLRLKGVVSHGFRNAALKLGDSYAADVNHCDQEQRRLGQDHQWPWATSKNSIDEDGVA
jgi:hypothetical protein